MKYYARINKENVGPLSLKELVEAGIRPSTYIWCKGMADWQPAGDDPEVCRAIRRYLAGLDPETGANMVSAEPGDQTVEPMPEEPGNAITGIHGIPEPPSQIDYSMQPPGVSVFTAIIVTLCCFPLTGAIAIFFALRCRADWKMAQQDGMSQAQSLEYRKKAWEDARIYRMMVGISLCLGLIMIGAAFSRTLL